LAHPASDGIGQHVYVTAFDANQTYFKPINNSDFYNGKYLQVAEPPATPPMARGMRVMSVSTKTSLFYAFTAPRIMRGGAFL